MPNASNLNFGTDDTVPNTVIVKVDNAGKVCLYTDAGTHLLADANGYFPAGSGYGALVPARLMDTSGPGTVDGQYWSPILGLVDGARCSPAWGCAA